MVYMKFNREEDRAIVNYHRVMCPRCGWTQPPATCERIRSLPGYAVLCENHGCNCVWAPELPPSYEVFSAPPEISPDI